MSKSKLVIQILLCCSLFGAVVIKTNVQAQDFPQWRGVNRDGRIEGLPVLKNWPPQLRAGWKIEVGAGHSSPLVMGGRVYLHSRLGENEVIQAIDLKTGRRVWQDSYPVEYAMNPAARSHGKGPKSTPVIAEGRLITLGITGILSVYDLTRGRLLWRRPFGDRLGARAPL